MFYVFTTDEAIDVRMSPSRAAEAIRRVFGHKVHDVKCVYCTKSTMIYIANDAKDGPHLGGVMLLCRAPMLGSVLNELVLSDCRTLMKRMNDVSAMLGRLNFNKSDYALYKRIILKKPSGERLKPRKVLARFKPRLGRLTVAGIPMEGTERTVDLSITSDYSSDVNFMYMFGCLVYDSNKHYRGHVISKFLEECHGVHGMLSATKGVRIDERRL